MNADECRKKADECLAAAQYASDGDAQRMWRQLADMWLLWSANLDRFRVYRESSIAAGNVESNGRPMAGALPIIKPVISDDANAAQAGDRLRSMLALNEKTVLD